MTPEAERLLAASAPRSTLRRPVKRPRPKEFLDRYYSRPDGSWYSVHIEWVYSVKLLRRSCSDTSPKQIILRKTELVAPEWREHKMPGQIARGDVLMCDGEPVTVTSLVVLGGRRFIGITGRWGFAPGHTHENLIEFLSPRYLLGEGLRLPFLGEPLPAKTISL